MATATATATAPIKASQQIKETAAALIAKGWEEKRTTGGSVWYKYWLQKATKDGQLVRVTFDSEDDIHLRTTVWSCEIPRSEVWTCEVEMHSFVRANVVAITAEAFYGAFAKLMPVEELFAKKSVNFDGQRFWRTGKTGTCVKTGQASAEFERNSGARVWVRQDGTVTAD